MPLRASVLFGQIAVGMDLAAKASIDELIADQDEKLVAARYVPLGELAVAAGVIDASADASIRHHVDFTTWREADKIIGDWLVAKGFATRKGVISALSRSKRAMARGDPELPRLVAEIARGKADDEKFLSLAGWLEENVLRPLHEMTRYFEVYADLDESEEEGLGRIAYQHGFVGREQLFAALLDRVDPSLREKDLLDLLWRRKAIEDRDVKRIRREATRLGVLW